MTSLRLGLAPARRSFDKILASPTGGDCRSFRSHPRTEPAALSKTAGSDRTPRSRREPARASSDHRCACRNPPGTAPEGGAPEAPNQPRAYLHSDQGTRNAADFSLGPSAIAGKDPPIRYSITAASNLCPSTQASIVVLTRSSAKVEASLGSTRRADSKR